MGVALRIGAFELDEPVPELHEPYAFAVLKPWIDVNNVGTMVLTDLESQFGARDAARLIRPSRFFDFTRYRPTVHLEDAIRSLSIPNTTVHYARREGEHDLLFLHLLEPHAFSEFYLGSVLKLLQHFKAKKYILLGSMYDWVPHTRPLIVNGGAIGRDTLQEFRRSGASQSNYQGPTSIVTLLLQKAPDMGIETLWFIVSLPQYVVEEEGDYLGKLRLMEILNLLYGIPIDQKDFEKAPAQRRAISEKVEGNAELRVLLPQLENLYDLRVDAKEGEGTPGLTSEVEELLWKIMGKDPGNTETKH